jgi:DNA-binding NarL/FixJ family response regulator
MRIRVAIMDGDRQFLLKAKEMLNAMPDSACVGAWAGFCAAARLAAANSEVVLLDSQLPGISAIDALDWLRSNAPSAHVILLVGDAARHEEVFFKALRAGAAGFLGKPLNPTALQTAIHLAISGMVTLSPADLRKLMDSCRPARKPTPYEALLSRRQRQVME